MAPTGNNMVYRHEIDGLRAVAVLSVIFSHAGFDWIPGGFAGVDAFFVISGFLITGIILRDLEEGCFTFRNFYARRARRILPALFCMLTSVSILAWLMLSPSQVQDISISVIASVLSLSNFYFIDFIDYFAPSSDYIGPLSQSFWLHPLLSANGAGAMSRGAIIFSLLLAFGRS
jgi:peptidoglycan/LPS O-acetylase OafA/YrhL